MSSSNSRPRTPPISSYSNRRSTKSPPPDGPSAGFSPPPSRPTYNDFISHTQADWNADDDEDEGDDKFTYDDEEDDEDDFGLPSITSVRRKAKPPLTQASKDPGGGSGARFNGIPNLITGLKPGRGRANSADIAEERGPPSYPTAKNAEGKILRPQYKDILKGTFCRSNSIAILLIFGSRPSKRIALDQ